MLFANCHLHSTFSDALYTPEKLVELAVQVGHKALILTDHDTIRGTYFLQKAARRAGLYTLLGCEFSTVSPEGKNVHLLGLDFNPENTKMKELLAYTAKRQATRTHLLFDFGLKNGTLRTGVTWEEVLTDHPDNDYFCNNQVFDTMVKRGIYTPAEYGDFFFATFHTGSNPAAATMLKEKLHMPPPQMTAVIDLIRAAGGVPVVAHPHGFAPFAAEWLKLGVLGFETIHPDLDDEDMAFFDDFCSTHHLYKMGGTDHSSLLGGYADTIPAHDLPATTGYTTEAEFMKLWRRELG